MGKWLLGAKKHLYKCIRPSVRPSVCPLRLFIFGGIKMLLSTAWPVLALVVYEMNASFSYNFIPLYTAAIATATNTATPWNSQVTDPDLTTLWVRFLKTHRRRSKHFPDTRHKMHFWKKPRIIQVKNHAKFFINNLGLCQTDMSFMMQLTSSILLFNLYS